MKSTNGLSQIALSAALFAFSLAARANECPIRVGEYSGTVKAEWLTKTREMRLLEPFAFKGPDCKVWPVPKDAIVDGASILQAFWTVIGGPFEGRYRDASVVHDYYCKVKTEPSDEVHKMFYHAMLANGVDSIRLALKFFVQLAIIQREYWQGCSSGCRRAGGIPRPVAGASDRGGLEVRRIPPRWMEPIDMAPAVAGPP